MGYLGGVSAEPATPRDVLDVLYSGSNVWLDRTECVAEVDCDSLEAE